MVDINENIDSPLFLKISFNKLLRYYEGLAQSGDPFLVAKALRVLDAANSFPALRNGFTNPELLQFHQKEINIILEDSFSDLLTKNEIKTASVPLHNLIFNSTTRFKSIIDEAGPEFKLTITNQPAEDMYRQACVIILYFYYGYKINLRRPFFYEIPDAKGILRTYKILYNADFVEFLPTEFTPKITNADYIQLLENYDDLDLWREKFPPKSYVFKGFTINNIFDVTEDRSISEIKSNLLTPGKINQYNANFVDNFQRLFESLFNIKNLKVGFVSFNKTEQRFEQIVGGKIQSYLLFNENGESCKSILCEASYQALIVDNTYFSIPDLESYARANQDELQINPLSDKNLKSAILAPIAANGALLGVLEIISPISHELNSVNANLLKDVMPYIVASVLRSKEEETNLIEAVIQQECTSIHPSVYWKFNRAARNFINASYLEDSNVVFEEITFSEVYPLYGQIDVQESSVTRNKATQVDLLLQLSLSKEILEAVVNADPLPFYENLTIQLEELIQQISLYLKIDSEPKLFSFFENKIHPLFKDLRSEHHSGSESIDRYFERLDENLLQIYDNRKKYDDTISSINKNMASILDQNQIEAQGRYLHYFERYKTDGVEHTMYIGKSITMDAKFAPHHLFDLRMWQIQVMCDMEHQFYRHKKSLPMAVNVASMILVFHQPITIQFRMDEKRFDVYGTYNARYEVMKKRVDKAMIKGTDKRVTEPGKLTIIYSQKQDEFEYLKYIEFLQAKNLFESPVEILELENLQGITGLKAIRVPIRYTPDGSESSYYNYQDLKKD